MMHGTTKRILARTLWVARGTATMVGLAVMLAVVLGLATTANAAAGDPLKLGRLNTASKLTQLVGAVAGPSLRIDNNSTEVGATALRLEVEPGKPPMSVNSTTEVNGLNVDSLDSMNSSEFLQESSDRDDFLPNRTYNTLGSARTLAEGETGFAEARCDPGDVALSGGYNFGLSNSSTVFSTGTAGDRYSVGFGGPRTVVPSVTCADFPPLR